MAARARFALVLLSGWTSLSLGLCALLSADGVPDRLQVDFTRPVDKTRATREEQHALLQDAMTEHMQLLYAKYNRAGFAFRDGNTVRSFKAHWGTSPNFYAF